MKTISHFRDLDVYQNALEWALQIFELTKKFPADERYSLTDEIRRSPRSVCANITDAWRKCRYEAAFIAKLNDVETEAAETLVHAEIAFRQGYLTNQVFEAADDAYDKMQIIRMMDHPEKWLDPAGCCETARRGTRETAMRGRADSPILPFAESLGFQKRCSKKL